MKMKSKNEKLHLGNLREKNEVLKSRKFRDDEIAIELPINIVVMLVVGMVALAALLSIIPKSKENL